MFNSSSSKKTVHEMSRLIFYENIYIHSLQQVLLDALRVKKKEVHGPQLAEMSETATADMQMACNIFPILL